MQALAKQFIKAVSYPNKLSAQSITKLAGVE